MELNKIYNMDCIEGMKQMDSESIDLIITDPFYVPKAQFDWTTFDKWYWNWNREWLIEAKRILKKDFHLLISFSSEDMAKFEFLLKELNFDIKSRMVWNYRNSAKATASNTKWAKTYEFIFHCSSGKKLNFPNEWDDRRFDVQTCAIPQSNFSEGKFHQYQKPLRLWKTLIEFASNPNEIVLDPFMGSGTTALVCKELGRNYIGFDINPEYCRIAEERIKGVSAQAKLLIGMNADVSASPLESNKTSPP